VAFQPPTTPTKHWSQITSIFVVSLIDGLLRSFGLMH
jgi:hypothetical protein